MTSIFIAGSIKLGRLNDKVRERLMNIISQNYRILVGDANGADKAVQKFLNEKAYKNVVVYCSGKYCRNNLGKWNSSFVSVDESIKGRDFYTEKDKKMAEDADYGLMIWDGKSAGTLSNVFELLKRNKKLLLYFAPSKQFLTISQSHQFEELLNQCSPDAIESIKKKVPLKPQSQTSVQGSLGF